MKEGGKGWMNDNYLYFYREENNMKMRRKKKEIIQTTFTGEPRPNKDEGLENFLKERIVFLKNIRKHQCPDNGEFKKQRTILKHNIDCLQFTLYEWEKRK